MSVAAVIYRRVQYFLAVCADVDQASVSSVGKMLRSLRNSLFVSHVWKLTHFDRFCESVGLRLTRWVNPFLFIRLVPESVCERFLIFAFKKDDAQKQCFISGHGACCTLAHVPPTREEHALIAVIEECQN